MFPRPFWVLEIVVGGPTLARGYLKDHAKTNAAFICSLAWSGSAGGRFYKTGDLVRYNPDGTIKIIGR
jgi:non-ribosomal peptide synthetase component F